MEVLIGLAIVVCLGMVVSQFVVAWSVLKLDRTLGRVRSTVAQEAAVAIVDDERHEIDTTRGDPILGL